MRARDAKRAISHVNRLIRMRSKIRKEIVAQSQKRSAVYDIVTNPTNVNVVVK